MALRLLVHVDVQSPVGEAERLRERLASTRGRPRGFVAAAPAGREHAGHREKGPPRRSAAEKLASVQSIGHSGPSIESTTKVESGLQLSVSRWPGEAPFRPGDA